MKIRTGYVSNSSSSSMLILDDKDRMRVLSLWCGFWTRERYTRLRRSLGGYKVTHASINWRFVETLLSPERDRHLLGNPLAYVLYDVQHHVQADTRGFPQDPEELRETTRTYMKSVEALRMGKGEFGKAIRLARRCMAGKVSGKDAKAILAWDITAMAQGFEEEAKKACPGAVSLWFASDDGTEEDRVIRCHGVLWDFVGYCQRKRIRAAYVDNS